MEKINWKGPNNMENTTKGTTSGESHDLRLKQLRSKDTRPNILILMTDQQRWDTIKANGADFMHTPNMDRLVKGGCNCINAYSPNPICAPARHNMLTGLTARSHKIPDNVWGVFLPRNIPTIPQILSENGYETRSIGKNHFTPPRRHNGYDRLELMEGVPGYREQDDYLMYLKNHDLGNVLSIHGVRNLLYMVPQRAFIPEEHQGTAWIANRTIKFIENNSGRHPWFLKASWIAPHPPFNVPDEFAEMYKGKNIPKPVTSKTPISPLAEENKLLGDVPNEDYMQRIRELYYGAISHIDHHIGRILKCLEVTGQLDNTLIFFISDHGEMLGDLGTYQKWIPYDACSRIPMILHFPNRIEKSSLCEKFTDLNDILPTILDAAEIQYPGTYELPGESLLKGNEGKKDRSHQYMEYGEGTRRWISLRNGEYKYNYYYGGALEELFDLKNDPHETSNLLCPDISTIPQAIIRIKEELKSELTKWENRWGLEGYVKDGELVKLPPYEQRPYRNRALPVFQEKIMDSQEKRAMNNIFDEILMAIEKEPIVNLKDLDLDAWKKNGNFSEEQMKNLLQKEAEMRITQNKIKLQ
jgi:arylsulfatase A-like enzyme